jgi:hypothetical protein
MSWLARMAVCAVALTTSVSWGESRAAGDRVTLWIEKPSEFAPLTSRQLEWELQSIVKPAGLRLSWRDLPPEAGSMVEGVLIVIRFHGVCGPASGDSHSARRPAGGWAHRSDGVVLPFVEIDCDQIWSVIEARLRGDGVIQQNLQMGRALARVVGHELWHVLANTATHSKDGLTKARLNSHELISATSSFSLTEDDLTPQVWLSDSPSPPALPAGRAGSRARQNEGNRHQVLLSNSGRR